MATVITEECINCGACEPECPNTAIFQGGVEFELNGSKQAALSGEIFFIVPEKCTECVGFFDYEACAAVCPVDCCIPDPDRPETEDVLIQRAKEIHPDKDFGEKFPSRFNPSTEEPAGGGEAAAADGAAAAAPQQVVAVAGASTPQIDVENFDVPVECRSCRGEYTVAYQFFQPGIVLRCPHCQANFCPTQRLFLAIGDRLDAYVDRVNEEVDRYNETMEAAQRDFDDANERHGEAAADEIRELVADLTEPRRAGVFG